MCVSWSFFIVSLSFFRTSFPPNHSPRLTCNSIVPLMSVCREDPELLIHQNDNHVDCKALICMTLPVGALLQKARVQADRVPFISVLMCVFEYLQWSHLFKQ